MIMCGSQPAIKFSVEVLYLFLTRASPSGMYSTFSQTFDALLKLHARKEAPPRFESVLEMNNERAFTLPLKKPILKGDSELMDIHSGMAQIFMNWIAIYYHPYSNETSHKYFIESLYSNIPPSGINIMSLFTSCAHLSIDSEKFLRFSPAEFSHLSNYQIVDAYARLIVLLIRYDYFKQCKMPPHQYNIDLFTNALASVVMSASSIHKLEEARFKQRPILRLFSSLLNDLATFTENLPIYPSLLATISDILCCTEPSLLPALTFAWIQVISHRNFMPRILSVKEVSLMSYRLKRLLTVCKCKSSLYSNGITIMRS